MCIAIYKPHGTKPLWDLYRNGHDGNPHGWGFAVVRKGQLIVKHGYSPDANKSWRQFKRAFGSYGGNQALIHFRWATHGNREAENCHPFFVSDGLAMIHNGVVNIDCDIDKTKSDTWHFVQHVLKPLHSENRNFFLAAHHAYTNQKAHYGSKFCFLRADGAHSIWNERDGKWEHGHWWSNTGYKAPKVRTVSKWYAGKSTTTSPSTTPSRIGGYYTSRYTTAQDEQFDADDLNVAAKKWYDDEYEYDLDYDPDGTAVATSSVHSKPASDSLIIAKPKPIVTDLPVTTAFDNDFDDDLTMSEKLDNLTAAYYQAEYVRSELIAEGLEESTVEDIHSVYGDAGVVAMGESVGIYPKNITSKRSEN